MNLGDHISYEKDGVIHTDRIESVHYRSGSPAIYRRLSRWQRVVRSLTPPRWRKSLLVRPAQSDSVTINADSPDAVGKTLAQLQQMQGAFDRLRH